MKVFVYFAAQIVKIYQKYYRFSPKQLLNPGTYDSANNTYTITTAIFHGESIQTNDMEN